MGRSVRGANGRMAWPPHSPQIAAWNSRGPSPVRARLAATRQAGQRWGSCSRPLLTKNDCSPAEKRNCSEQSRHVRVRSSYTVLPRLLRLPPGAGRRARPDGRAAESGGGGGAGQTARSVPTGPWAAETLCARIRAASRPGKRVNRGKRRPRRRTSQTYRSGHRRRPADRTGQRGRPGAARRGHRCANRRGHRRANRRGNPTGRRSVGATCRTHCWPRSCLLPPSC